MWVTRARVLNRAVTTARARCFRNSTRIRQVLILLLLLFRFSLCIIYYDHSLLGNLGQLAGYAIYEELASDRL